MQRNDCDEQAAGEAMSAKAFCSVSLFIRTGKAQTVFGMRISSQGLWAPVAPTLEFGWNVASAYCTQAMIRARYPAWVEGCKPPVLHWWQQSIACVRLW